MTDSSLTSEKESFTRSELDFIISEMYGAMANGADHPLFSQVHEKAKRMKPVRFRTLICAKC